MPTLGIPGDLLRGHLDTMKILKPQFQIESEKSNEFFYAQSIESVGIESQMNQIVQKIQFKEGLLAKDNRKEIKNQDLNVEQVAIKLLLESQVSPQKN